MIVRTGWRIIERGSDWRFTKLIAGGAAYNAFGWVSQGTWIFLQGCAVWVVHHGPAAASAAPLRPLDYLGVAVWAVGLFVEHTADMQKTRWNKAYSSGQQKTWLAEGVRAMPCGPQILSLVLSGSCARFQSC